MSMKTEVKTHVLTLEVGDRFRFREDGPIFQRVQGPDDRVWIRDACSNNLPAHRLESGQCFVFAIDPFAERDNPS